METEARYGSLIAGGLFVWVVIEFLAGFHSERSGWHEFVRFGGLAFVFTGILLGVKKKKEEEGTIEFRPAFRSGLMITLIAAAFQPFASIIFYRFINPAFSETMVDAAVKKAIGDGLNDLQVAERINEARHFFSLQNYMVVSAIAIIVSGLVFTFFIAFFLSRRST